MSSDISSPSLKHAGQARIDWAGRFMPVLGSIKKRFQKEKPLKGLRVSACLHVTTETGQLAEVLRAGARPSPTRARTPARRSRRRRRSNCP